MVRGRDTPLFCPRSCVPRGRGDRTVEGNATPGKAGSVGNTVARARTMDQKRLEASVERIDEREGNIRRTVTFI